MDAAQDGGEGVFRVIANTQISTTMKRLPEILTLFGLVVIAFLRRRYYEMAWEVYHAKFMLTWLSLGVAGIRCAAVHDVRANPRAYPTPLPCVSAVLEPAAARRGSQPIAT